jgi:hypothetical protein
VSSKWTDPRELPIEPKPSQPTGGQGANVVQLIVGIVLLILGLLLIRFAFAMYQAWQAFS